MKRRVTGRRFTRRESIEYTNAKELARAFAKAGRPAGKGYVMGMSLTERVTRMAENAAKLLEARELPAFPTVYTDTEGNLTGEPPANFKSKASLDNYIIKQKGHPHDSPEGFAAQIITLAERMKRETGEAQLAHAFALGELRAMAKAYGIEAGTNRKNAKGERRREWALHFAQYLREKHKTFPEAWESIPEDGMRFGDREIYRDDDTLCASSHEHGDDRIKKESFRTGYFCKPVE